MPGLDGTGRLFEPLIDRLGVKMNTSVVSYPSTEELSLAELARMVLRKLPDGKSVLLAESFSGLVALTLLMEASARIKGVIFVGAFAEPPRPLLLRLAPLMSRSAAFLRAAPSFLLRQYCVGRSATSAQLKMIRSALAEVAPNVLAHRFAMVGSWTSFGKMRFDVPCCYLRAKDDRLVPARCADWFRDRFRKFELKEIEGPHFLLQAKPQESAAVIEDFVQHLD